VSVLDLTVETAHRSPFTTHPRALLHAPSTEDSGAEEGVPLNGNSASERRSYYRKSVSVLDFIVETAHRSPYSTHLRPLLHVPSAGDSTMTTTTTITLPAAAMITIELHHDLSLIEMLIIRNTE
jgi:hypothetical protein